MRASGAGGMIGGQLLDLEGEGRPLVARGAGAHPPREDGRADRGVGAARRDRRGRGRRGARRRSAAYGDAIGLAFQIADDVLDVTATTDQLGKTAGRDLALRKSTYPALLGVEGARARASALVDEGCARPRGRGPADARAGASGPLRCESQ